MSDAICDCFIAKWISEMNDREIRVAEIDRHMQRFQMVACGTLFFDPCFGCAKHSRT